ncbi:MAG TPA: hypothetical protein DCQ31_03005, partial [Bacteroidales bacterium]|nr:hypothetical protein [Bacteroidales bacterium]
MRTIILILVFMAVSKPTAFSQCNEKLLEIAKSDVTKNEVFLQDFKIKLDEASVKEPVPVAAFSYKLDSAKHYRFRIISDEVENKGKGILRMFGGEKLQATSYHEAFDKHYPIFDFMCQKQNDYKLLITFKDGKKGCAVVLIT